MLITELIRPLAEIAQRFESIRLGLYLHGSQARDEAGPRSDVDVLGLCVADDATARLAERACREALAGQPWHDRPDLKVVDADEFAADPWVDLRRSRPLAGFAWHQTLPPRTPDQAGRESLGVLAVYFEDGDFELRDPVELRKPVGRLCSVLAALVGGAVPHSANEALRMLPTEGRLSRELRDLRGELERVPEGSRVSDDLSSRVRRAADDVAAVLRVHVERGVLGPICTAAGEDALAKHRSRPAAG